MCKFATMRVAGRQKVHVALTVRNFGAATMSPLGAQIVHKYVIWSTWAALSILLFLKMEPQEWEPAARPRDFNSDDEMLPQPKRQKRHKFKTFAERVKNVS